MKWNLKWSEADLPRDARRRNRNREWFERKVILIRLEDDSGRVGFGEIAPLAGFGGESLEKAKDFLESLCGVWDDAKGVPDERHLPCSASALSGAAAFADDLKRISADDSIVNTAFPGGLREAAENWREFTALGFRHFKIKLGFQQFEPECDQLSHLLDELPGDVRVRLDANGGFTIRQWERWVDIFAHHPAIEFLEQPLCLADSLRHGPSLAAAHGILPLALDESVQTPEDWKRWLEDFDWPGYMVMKPSMFGHWSTVRRTLAACRDRVCLSSAMESPVGQAAIFRLAVLEKVPLPVGMGVCAETARRSVLGKSLLEDAFRFGRERVS